MHYAVGLVAIGFAFLLLRRFLLSAVCMVAGGILFSTFAGDFIPRPSPNAPETLQLVAFNVHTTNSRHDDVVRYLRETKADLVLLQEVNSDWIRSLDALRDAYPQRFGVAREDNFGIVILSRIPLVDPRVNEFGSFKIPWLSASFEIGGASCRIAGVHTLPPINPTYFRLRNRELQMVADWINTSDPARTIVMGDLNVTVFSPWMTDFLRISHLRDSTSGFGLWPTWLAPLGLPIDQVAIGDRWRVVSRTIGPPLGSDHRPVVTEIILR